MAEESRRNKILRFAQDDVIKQKIMITKEIFKKIRQIEITTNRLVSDIFAGQYHSAFKGEGIEFDEVREYQPGDDIRTIDWNVTARTGKAHIKKFVEEREMSVMILVDASASTRFGSVNQLKSSLAAEMAAVLAASATRNNDKVGLIIFSDKIEKYIPPRKGLRHVLRVVREILYFKPEGRRTDIELALEYLNKVTNHKMVTFLISDFMDTIDQAGAFKKALSIANKKHDIIAIALSDPREREMIHCGLIDCVDAETGARIVVDSTSRKVRENFKAQSIKRREQRAALFRSCAIDQIEISTGEPYIKALVKFFKQRRKRLAR